MARVRELLGVARDSIDPTSDLDSRRDSRALLATAIAQQFYPDRLRRARSPRRGSTLFPSVWRSVDRRSTSDTAVLWLRDDPHASFVRELEQVDLHADVIVVSANAKGANQYPVPARWSTGRRCLAAIEIGALDTYQWVVVVAGLSPAASDVAQALRSCGDPHVGAVCSETTTPSATTWNWLNRRLAELYWPQPADVLAAPSAPSFVCRAFLLQGLRALRLTPETFSSSSPGIEDERLCALVGALGAEADARVAKPSEAPSPAAPWRRPRIVPFYLPQFHRVAENDRWWGPGFTEWTNVAAAVPNFRGHYQPKLPADLGFYDLRIDSVREQQADLAKAAGVAGFMYYHYWFAGSRILDAPLDALCQQTDLDQPYCLMWANEDWARSWDGNPSQMLLRQEHDRVPPTTFLDHAVKYLDDPRYMTIDGRKILAVYRPDSIPQFPDVVEAWRLTAERAGHSLYVLGVEYGALDERARSALDGTMSFPPHHKKYVRVSAVRAQVDRHFRGSLFSYEAMVEADIQGLKKLASNHVPGVMIGWDNTPRRQLKAHTWLGSNPYTFRRWLLAASEAVSDRPADHRVVFVNAWNEWAEGAVLEPSTEWGQAYLGAVRDIAMS